MMFLECQNEPHDQERIALDCPSARCNMIELAFSSLLFRRGVAPLSRLYIFIQCAFIARQVPAPIGALCSNACWHLEGPMPTLL